MQFNIIILGRGGSSVHDTTSWYFLVNLMAIWDPPTLSTGKSMVLPCYRVQDPPLLPENPWYYPVYAFKTHQDPPLKSKEDSKIDYYVI